MTNKPWTQEDVVRIAEERAQFRDAAKAILTMYLLEFGTDAAWHASLDFEILTVGHSAVTMFHQDVTLDDVTTITHEFPLEYFWDPEWLAKKKLALAEEAAAATVRARGQEAAKATAKEAREKALYEQLKAKYGS